MAADDATVLFRWGEANHPFTLRTACEGVFITGANGSGKTSGSGYAIARAYLQAGFGGLVLTVKPGDVFDWVQYARRAGREKDLVIVRPDQADSGRHCFNFLEYELSRPGRGGGITENIVAVLVNVLSPGIGARISSSDRFWDDTLRELLRNVVATASLAGERLTLRLLVDILLTAPHSTDEARSSSFLEKSLCARLLRQAFQRQDLSPSAREDLSHTVSYWDAKFPRLAEKTRSIIEQSLSSMIDGLLRAPLRELLCEKSTFFPEDSEQGSILVLDMPTKQFGEAGRLAQLIVKTAWMAAIERRNISVSPRPVFLFQDEAQTFLTPEDKAFAQTARDRRAAIVSLTQNLSGFYSAMHAPDPRSACDAYVGCLNTKVFHFNEDPATCEFAERLFGREDRYRGGGSFSIEGKHPNERSEQATVRRSVDFRREERPRVPAASLRTLRRGGRENACNVDAIISEAGTLIRHTFLQEASTP